MDKVEKIKIEIEKRRNAIDYIGMPTCAEYNRVWAYNDVLEIIDSLEEEPVSSIWHDASEMPDKEKKILTIGYNDETYVSYFNGVNPRLIKQWAYIDDILNLSNVERTVKSWKEPVSEDLELEEEITKCYNSRIDLMMTRKQFGELIHRFTNWQKRQDQETIELAEDHAMLAGMVKGKEHTIGEVRSILNKIAYRNNGLDVNGDYCEQPYIELDNEFNKLLKEE